MATFSAEREDRDGVIVVKLQGSMGIEGLDALDRHLHPIAAARPKLVVLDLSGVEHISSLAIGSLVSLYNAVKRHDGKVALGPMHENVQGVLRRCRLEDVMAIYESVDAAIAANKAVETDAAGEA